MKKNMTAQELKRIRRSLGLTQKEFALNLDRSVSALKLYERGVQPIPEDIAEVAEGLGATARRPSSIDAEFEAALRSAVSDAVATHSAALQDQLKRFRLDIEAMIAPLLREQSTAGFSKKGRASEGADNRHRAEAPRRVPISRFNALDMARWALREAGSTGLTATGLMEFGRGNGQSNVSIDTYRGALKRLVNNGEAYRARRGVMVATDGLVHVIPV